MSIQIQYTGELGGDLSFGGNFVVVCDHCGGTIDRQAPGNVEYPLGKAGERKEVFYLHKECSTPFRDARHRAGKERLLWRELKKVRIETR